MGEGKVYYVFAADRVFMDQTGTAAHIIDLTSGLMRFYPLFLKASLLLQRLVQ